MDILLFKKIDSPRLAVLILLFWNRTMTSFVDFRSVAIARKLYYFTVDVCKPIREESTSRQLLSVERVVCTTGLDGKREKSRNERVTAR